MLKMGFAGLALSAGCALLLSLLSWMGVAHFGSCGPDTVGLIFFVGFLIGGFFGILLTGAGLVQLGYRKLQHRRGAPSQ